MEQDDELILAKNNLNEALGDHFKKYLNLLKDWFKFQLSKEEFDSRARDFLPKECIHYHNEFLLALFNKCSVLAPKKLAEITETNDKTESIDEQKNETKLPYHLDVKQEKNENTLNGINGNEVTKFTAATVKRKNSNANRKPKKYKVNFDKRYDRTVINDHDYLSATRICDDKQKLIKLSSSSQDNSLPDYFMSHLRMFVLIWESNLDGVQDEAVKLCTIALREFIKNLLISICSQRSSYRLYDKRMKHGIGNPSVNPYIKTASIQQINDDSDQYEDVNESTKNAITKLSRSHQAHHLKSLGQPDYGPITLWHLYNALRKDRSAIPMHGVYVVNIQKILAKLSHPVDD